jgi:hypothetical protein
MQLIASLMYAQPTIGANAPVIFTLANLVPVDDLAAIDAIAQEVEQRTGTERPTAFFLWPLRGELAERQHFAPKTL